MLRVDARILDLTRSAQNEPPSAQALNQVLWLVYHQNDDFCAVAMFDEHGALIGKPASLEDPSRYESLKNHEPMRPTDVEGVGLMAPLGAALSSGQGIGPIFLGGPLRLPHVVLAVAFDPELRRRQAHPGRRGVAQAARQLRRVAVDAGHRRQAARRPRPAVRRGLGPAGATSWNRSASPARGEGELPPGEIVAEYVNGNRHLIGAYAPIDALGPGGRRRQDGRRRPVARSTASGWRRCSGW